MEKLVGHDKDREIPYHWKNRLDLGKINLIYCQLKIKLDGEEKKPRTKTPSPRPLLPRLSFTPSFPAPRPPPLLRSPGEWGTGVVVSP